jgi:siroheme synthase (precorrin-2 oxidase/ferrochelatase)
MKYIVISQQTKKFLVAREGIGTYYIIATCTSEDYAKRIAAAMNEERLPVVVTKAPKKKAK